MSWQERSGRLICTAFGVAVGFWLLRHAFGAVLPFLIALLLSSVFSPMARRLAAACHLPRKLCAFFLVSFALLGLIGLLWLCFTRLLQEAEALLAGLREAPTEGWGRLPLYAYVPARWRQSVDRVLTQPWARELAQRIMVGLSGLLAEALKRLVSVLPALLWSWMVTVVATFSMTLGGEGFLNWCRERLPDSVQGKLGGWWSKVKQVAAGYGRAVGLLFLLTFGILFVGLWILDRPYALLCALCIAAVDVLPILGSGTVLIPWATWMFLRGNPATGLGLLILYGAVTVVRQIAEPHLVGGNLGLPPLLSLFSMVLGLRLLGLWGMLLAPFLVAFLCQVLWPEKGKKKMKAPPKKSLTE